jgi:hypothetical protein
MRGGCEAAAMRCCKSAHHTCPPTSPAQYRVQQLSLALLQASLVIARLYFQPQCIAAAFPPGTLSDAEEVALDDTERAKQGRGPSLA